MATVTVYARAGCHLCDDALAALDRIAAVLPFSLHVVDIETDDVLHARYLERIPVVALDGEELYDFAVDETDLTRRLRAIESPGA